MQLLWNCGYILVSQACRCCRFAKLAQARCSFAELSKALDPRKDVKTDKTSIVADAIRVVTQLRAENGQLKQLNKFLEVHTCQMRHDLDNKRGRKDSRCLRSTHWIIALCRSAWVQWRNKRRI